jgi:hypothetical protein
MCPYPDCDDDIHLDRFDWDEFRTMSKQNDLPEIPIPGWNTINKFDSA